MPKRMMARVEGHVQGVGFRAFARREARKRGLTGMVRNLPDGSVEIIAEGPEETLLDLTKALSRGPAGGHVTRVQCRWSEAGGEFADFEVHYS